MKKLPEFITFTGIDDRTDLTAADKLASQYPIEWGVLFSSNNRDARFPCKQAVDEILHISGAKSAHLCGFTCRQAQAGKIGDLPLKRFNRAQFNGFNLDTSRFLRIEATFDLKIIQQHRRQAFCSNGDFLQLYDCSGGAGILPKLIPPLPGNGKLVGYAGGMGPDSVLEYLDRIEGDGPFWIDMEGRIRTNGWFDVDKVRQVCEQVYG